MGIGGTYLNMIGAMCDKPTANILNSEKLNVFTVRSGIRQGCPLSPLLLSMEAVQCVMDRFYSLCNIA